MSENLICECAECVSARRWIADKTGLGGGPRPLAFLIASHEQHERELAAAEERGRRRGVEEGFRRGVENAAQWLKVSEPLRLAMHRALSDHAALAPRDSGKDQP